MTLTWLRHTEFGLKLNERSHRQQLNWKSLFFWMMVDVILNYICIRLYIRRCQLQIDNDDFQFLINRWPVTSQTFTLWHTHSKGALEYKFNCPLDFHEEKWSLFNKIVCLPHKLQPSKVHGVLHTSLWDATQDSINHITNSPADVSVQQAWIHISASNQHLTPLILLS